MYCCVYLFNNIHFRPFFTVAVFVEERNIYVLKQNSSWPKQCTAIVFMGNYDIFTHIT